jgi:hypothetical protein
MGALEHRFLTHWRIFGTAREVADVLGATEELSRWWPSVYLEAEQVEAGDEAGIGRRVRLRTKGWLPYTLDWDLRVTESRYPFGFSIEARGDLVGTGVWTFEPVGAWTLVTYDWRVRAEKPLLKALSPFLLPAFEANHRWAMRRGEESLRLELERRRAATPADRARIPAPPLPSSAAPLILAGVAAGVLAFGLGRLLLGRRGRRRRRRR